MGPLIHFQKVYTIAYLLIAVISISISFLLKKTKSENILFVRIITIGYFILYAIGQALGSFNQSIVLMQISYFINIYILEVFPVIYYLSLFKLINRKWNGLLHLSLIALSTLNTLAQTTTALPIYFNLLRLRSHKDNT